MACGGCAQRRIMLRAAGQAVVAGDIAKAGEQIAAVARSAGADAAGLAAAARRLAAARLRLRR